MTKVSMTSSSLLKKHSLCDECFFDGYTTEACGFCVDCVESLCPDCIKGHRKNKASRNHVVVSVTSDQSRSENIFTFFKFALTCQEHADSHFTHYCEGHKQYVCSQCLKTSHQDCKTIRDKPRGSMDLKSLNNLASDLHTHTAKLRKKIESTRKSLAENSKHIADQRKQTVKRTHKQVNELERKLGGETDELVKALLGKTQLGLTECNNTQVELDAIENIVTFVDQSNINTHGVLVARLQLKLKNLKRKIEGHVNKPMGRVVFLKKSQRVKSLGTVEMRPIDNDTNCELIDTVKDKVKTDLTLSRETAHIVNPGTGIKSKEICTSTNSVDNLIVKPKLPMTKNVPDPPGPLGIRLDSGQRNAIAESVEKPDDSMEKETQDESLHAAADSPVSIDDESIPIINDVFNTASFFHCKSETKDMSCKGKETERLSAKACKLQSSFSLSKKGKHSSNITDMAVLTNGWLVVADNANKVMEVFDEVGHYLHRVAYRLAPTRLCDLPDVHLAVIFSDSISIVSGRVTSENIQKESSFTSDHKCIDITRFRNDVALLVETEEDYMIHVCNINDGRILMKIDSFTNRKQAPLKFKNPSCLLHVGNKKFVIGTGHKVHCINQYGNEIWYYRQYGYTIKIDAVTCLAADQESNVYICCKGSENVHQVCSYHMWTHRIIIPHLEYASAIAFDKSREKLYTGCFNGDKIDCYGLE